MDLVLNVSLGDVDLTYSMSWFSVYLFMSFRRSLFRCFSSSLRFFLNSHFEHLWPLLPVNNKSCLFLCPLFILFKWGFFIEQVFPLLLQASHSVSKGFILHTGHTCLDHTFLSPITRTDRLKMWDTHPGYIEAWWQKDASCPLSHLWFVSQLC